DSSTRRIEATSLRTQLNNVPAGTNFLVGGDTNIYGAYEGAYIRLTESQADNDGQGFDVLSMPGSWHSIAGYAANDTQSPCNTGCFSGPSVAVSTTGSISSSPRARCGTAPGSTSRRQATAPTGTTVTISTTT